MTTDEIVAEYFRLPQETQRVFLVSLIILTDPRIRLQLEEQMKAHVSAAVSTAGRQPLPAAAGTAARLASDGGEAAALGKNTDLVATVDSEILADVQIQSDASSRAPSVQRVARSRVLLLTVPVVAQKLGISVAALRREIRCGRFPRPMKIGGQNRFSPAQVEAFLEQFGTAERIAFYKRTGTERQCRRRLNNEMVRLHSELLVERKRRGHA